MELSQLEDLYHWRRSFWGLGKEAIRMPSSCSSRPPSNPRQLLAWLASLELPMLKDETPPPSFYFDLLEANAVALDRSVHSGKLLITLGSQTEQVPEEYVSHTLALLATTALQLCRPGDAPASPCHAASGDAVPLPVLQDTGTCPNVQLSTLVGIGTGPDLAHIPRLVEKGTGTDPYPVSMDTDLPHASSESFSAVLMRAFLALSVLHAVYVFSRITFDTFMTHVWEAFVQDLPPPRTPSIEETPAFLSAGIWQRIVAKLAELRTRFP
ncbi:uncharacterized protein LOC6524432 [Drosophila yakuba]|uniref:Uncharacterized protein n=1 Tax=Drosophila yakuba TaxID=7245 RepID=B4Q191_DROYA|nr:uncharacterized protein LOC6524432 [Drosophila yakuba]EDX01398.1 uncharacterized protein Dyak_GE16970 [Drosophila yakuba]